MKSRKFWQGCIIAVLLTVGATGLRSAFNPTLGLRSPFLFHVLAIAIAAQLAGAVPGLIVTGLSLVLIKYLFIPPLHTLGWQPSPGDSLALLLFAIVGIFLSLLAGRRKRTEDELRRIRYNLDTAQEIANIGSWESDLVGKIWWSDHTYRMFGVSPEAALTVEDFYALVHEEDRDRVRQAVAEAVRTRSDYNIEHRIVRKSDGEVRYVHQRAKVSNYHGTHLIGSVEDVTDQKRGEMAQQILGGLLQVCSACRRIRDAESDQWYSMEGYLRRHSSARFSHGMCEDCGKQWYSEALGGEPGRDR